MAKEKSKKKFSKKSTPTKTKNLTSQPSWFTNKSLHCLLIFLFSCLLYANTLTHKYTQDDAIVIYDNEYTVKGISGIPDILTKDTFRGFFKVDGKEKLVSGGRYRPLTLVMFAIEVQFFGQSPMVGHLVNILLYAMTCVLLYILLLRMLKDYGENDFAYFVALATALIFAAHPIHTEAVANIKGRDEIVALLGSLAAAYLCLRSWQEQKMSLSIIAGLVFFITLFSKENAITFLGVIPMMFLFFTKASIGDIAKRVAPLVLGALAFLAIRASIIGGGLGEPPMELMNNPYVKLEGNRYIPFDASERLGTIFYTLWKYIQLQIFPHPLTHDYYPRHIDIINMTDWRALLGLLSHIGLLAYALIRFPKRDLVSFGILFYLGTLFIVSNLLFPIGTNMAERLIFMPSVGFCLVVAVLLYRLTEVLDKSSKRDFKALMPALGGMALITILFSVKTFTRNPAWKDNFTLFTTDVKVSKNSAKLQNSVGGELLTQSRKETDETKRMSMVQSSIPHLQKAIEIHPTYKNAYLLLGNAYNYSKDFANANKNYEQALKLDPNYPEAIQNLAISYRENGIKLRDSGNGNAAKAQFDKAIAQFARLENAPNRKLAARENTAMVYEEMGKLYGMQQQHELALENFKKAIDYSADKGKYEYFVGLAYAQMNNVPKAIEYMEKAFNLTPKDENKGYIAKSLGDIYKSVDPQKSQEYYQKSTQFQK